MKDRIVEFPGRYRLIPVAGQEEVYDFLAVHGVVTEVGTPINKANLLSDAARDCAELLEDDATVSNAISRVAYGAASYLAFIGNTNADQLDAAFGTLNEEQITCLGKALAMYTKFKGDPLSANGVLSKCNTIDDVMCSVVRTYQSFLEKVTKAGTSLEKTFDIAITQEMIDGSSKLSIIYKLVGGGPNAAGLARLLLNNVVVAEANTTGVSGTKYFINLADYNITAAGTYPVRIVLNATNPSYIISGGIYVDCEIKKTDVSGTDMTALYELVGNPALIDLMYTSAYAAMRLEFSPMKFVGEDLQLTVTQEDITQNALYHCAVKLIAKKGSYKSTVSVNGVTVFELKSSSSTGKTEEMQKTFNLSDFNITEAGTYTIALTNDSNRTATLQQMRMIKKEMSV